MKINKTYRLLFVFLGISLLHPAFCQKSDPARLERIVNELADDSYLGRGFGTEEGRKAAEYIVSEMEKSGVDPFFESWLHSFHYRRSSFNIDGNNVVGIIRSEHTELADEYIIIGAHYDHVGWKKVNGDTIVYNGADDNASGVAGVIELGRLFSENRDKLGRSIVLMAFDGEETGLIGSQKFVDEFLSGSNPRIDPASVAAMFSLDMIGMYDTHGGIDILGIEMIDSHAEILDGALEAAPVEIVKSNGILQNRTDTAPFGRIGIPSVHIWTSTESPYHKPEDDSHLLEYESMGKIVDFTYALTMELSKSETVNAKGMDPGADTKDKIFTPMISLNAGSSYFDYEDFWYRSHSVFSYAAGVALEARIGKLLALQPEALYEWSGSKVASGNLHMHSLTIPVSMLIKTMDPSGMGVRVYYQAGGYYRYVFGSSDPDYAIDFQEMDYGLTMGGGFDIMKVRIGYVYRISLQDISKTDPLNTRIKGSYFNISYRF